MDGESYQESRRKLSSDELKVQEWMAQQTVASESSTRPLQAAPREGGFRRYLVEPLSQATYLSMFDKKQWELLSFFILQVMQRLHHFQQVWLFCFLHPWGQGV